jgi:hypothetical protein
MSLQTRHVLPFLEEYQAVRILGIDLYAMADAARLTSGTVYVFKA